MHAWNDDDDRDFFIRHIYIYARVSSSLSQASIQEVAYKATIIF